MRVWFVLLLVCCSFFVVADDSDSFGVLAFVEGGNYSLELFEFLWGADSGVGLEYNTTVVLDDMASPDWNASGGVYSAFVGGYGLLSTPVVSSYCGDGVCDSGESCSSCSSDCGVCAFSEVESVADSGWGGCEEGFEIVGGKCVLIEVEEVEEVVLPEEVLLPERLFDISFSLESLKVSSSEDVLGVVLFESFGSVLTFVDLTFVIESVDGIEVYEESARISVETERVFMWGYDDLVDLPDGEYVAVLRTVYNVDVEDEFVQRFEVRSENGFPWVFVGVGVLGLVIVFGAYGFVRRFSRRRRRRRVARRLVR